jgi:hypothetical protein
LVFFLIEPGPNKEFQINTRATGDASDRTAAVKVMKIGHGPYFCSKATMRRAHLPNTGIIEGRDSMEHGEGRKEHSNRNAARQRPSKIPGKPVQEVWPCQ